MADMFEPVRLKSEEFSQLIMGVERAFSRHAAALVVDERLPSPEIEVLDWEETELDKETVEKYRIVIDYFDQLMLFAFADAPDQVVSEWANGYDPSLKDEALKRVEVVRSSMPLLRDLWDAKVSSVIPILSSVAYDIITVEGEDSTAKSVILNLSAAKLSIFGRVDKSSAQSVILRLWPNDLKLLKREIDHLLKDHFNGEDGT